MVPTPLVEKTILSSIELSGIFVKNQSPVNVVYFWIINSIPLTYMLIFLPVPRSLDPCSLIVTFEIRKCESLNFVSFQIILTVQLPCL